VRRRAALLLAIVPVVVIADLLVGTALSAFGVLPPVDRGDLLAEERRQDGGATANEDEPWAAALADELVRYQTEDVTYEPFLVQGTHEFHGRHLNTTDVERVTYRPAAGRDGDRPQRVAFFGGSVVFGIGQRDEHTIPSEFARVAEEAGVSVEVHNYGVPRWVAWQELQYAERILDHEGPFDLVVFYDGYNELLVQAEQTTTEPTHHGAATLQHLVSDYADEHETEPGLGDALGDLWSSYRRSSAGLRLLDRVTGRTAPDTGTETTSTASAEAQADAAISIYRRAVRWISDVAADHRTAASFVWQPQRDGWPPEVLAALPPDVLDLSSLFDGEEDDVYFDPIHTNEAGARRAAEALWAELGPTLEVSSGPSAARTSDPGG